MGAFGKKGPSGPFVVCVIEKHVPCLSELKELRNRAAEYLRRGIEQIQAAAGFVFQGEKKQLSRYPSISIMKRRRKTDTAEPVNNEIEAEEEIEIESITPAQVETTPVMSVPSHTLQ